MPSHHQTFTSILLFLRPRFIGFRAIKTPVTLAHSIDWTASLFFSIFVENCRRAKVVVKVFPVRSFSSVRVPNCFYTFNLKERGQTILKIIFSPLFIHCTFYREANRKKKNALKKFNFRCCFVFSYLLSSLHCTHIYISFVGMYSIFDSTGGWGAALVGIHLALDLCAFSASSLSNTMSTCFIFKRRG